MEKDFMNKFTIAHSLKPHPIEQMRQSAQQRYLAVLTYLVKQFQTGEYEVAMISQYRSLLHRGESSTVLTEKNKKSNLKAILNPTFRPWAWQNKIWLLCDIALILQNDEDIRVAKTILDEFLNAKQRALMDLLVNVLLDEDTVPPQLSFATGRIEQFWLNRKFAKQSDLRVFVTANMSAGKSTLINAIIGKPIARTAQEACTANISYLLDKPFEDCAVHLLASSLNLNATIRDLSLHDNNVVSFIATYFRKLVKSNARIILVDTPGVNSAMHQDHRDFTQHTLENETYDKLIYVLNANKLGTDEELQYLKYITQRNSQDKVVFVLNKLDDFKCSEDSIADSIEAVRNDLLQLGYSNPCICPMSAYCAWLLKMKAAGEVLTADEEDMYQFYLKKFKKSEYNLSNYYHNSASIPAETESVALARQCGIYGFESILYGGVK